MKANNKLREALSDACYAMFNFLKEQNGGYEEMANALDKAKAALAEPVRNCEVGTVEEQARRFNDYCHKQGNSCSVGRSKGACPMFKGYKVDCAIVWSQSLYEKGGAK